MPTIQPIETIRFSDICQGVIWRDDAGFQGCLKFDIEGDTNFVGPFASTLGARNALRAEFLASVDARPVTDPPFARGM